MNCVGDFIFPRVRSAVNALLLRPRNTAAAYLNGMRKKKELCLFKLDPSIVEIEDVLRPTEGKQFVSSACQTKDEI
jgi:hypothetical protein